MISQGRDQNFKARLARAPVTRNLHGGGTANNSHDLSGPLWQCGFRTKSLSNVVSANEPHLWIAGKHEARDWMANLKATVRENTFAIPPGLLVNLVMSATYLHTALVCWGNPRRWHKIDSIDTKQRQLLSSV